MERMRSVGDERKESVRYEWHAFVKIWVDLDLQALIVPPRVG